MSNAQIHIELDSNNVQSIHELCKVGVGNKSESICGVDSQAMVFDIDHDIITYNTDKLTGANLLVTDSCTRNLRAHVNEWRDSLIDNLTNAGGGAIFSMPNISVGTTLSYYPVQDTNYLVQGLRTTYWVNASETIMGMPFRFGVVTGDGISMNEDVFNTPLVYNFEFDYLHYLTDYKEDLVVDLLSNQDEIVSKFESIDFADSIGIYNAVKDTLANIDYMVFVNKAKEEKVAILDSISNCYEVDSMNLATLDSIIEKYESYRNEFNRLVAFQQKYYNLKKEYEGYVSSLEHAKDVIANTNPKALLANAEALGLNSSLPKWPLNLRNVSYGAQFVNHTPLTFQNYASHGLMVDYNADNLIVSTGILNRKWGTGLSIVSEDSLFNPYSSNQAGYLAAVGFGDLDSSYILFTTAIVKEVLGFEMSDMEYSNMLISVYQRRKILHYLNFEYEIANSGYRTNPGFNDSTQVGGIKSQAATFLKLGYTLNKTNSTLFVDHTLTGNAFRSLGNIFLRPGTNNLGIGLTQTLLNSGLSATYKYIYSSSLQSNPEAIQSSYHLLQLDYSVKKLGSVHLSMMPYSFKFSIPEVEGTNNELSTNLFNACAVIQIPSTKVPNTTIVNYANYSTQSSYLDTVLFIQTHSFSLYSSVSISGKEFVMNAFYQLPTDDDLSFFANSIGIMGSVVEQSNLHIDVGPKFLDFTMFNDQFGGSVNLSWRLGKYVYWTLSLDKYVEIEDNKTSYPSKVFFNSSIILTIN